MAMRKIPSVAIVAVALVGLFLTLTTAGLLSVNQSVPTSGVVSSVNVGVYSDSACTQLLTSISWGSVSPGSTVTRTCYVKNTGTASITLSMTTNSWSPPSAEGPIGLAWDRENTAISSGQVVLATFTLTVSSSISGVTNFSFNVVVTGTG